VLQRVAVFVFVLFVAAVVNFPLAHSTYLAGQLQRSGEDVIATVTEAREVGDDFVVVVSIPASDERAEFRGGVAQVDQLTWIEARDTRAIAARVLPDRAGVFEVRGQQRGRLGLVVTVIADLVIALLVVLRLRFGPRPFDEA
jgi:hypothetical protein